jgi:hypothetical protein
MHHLILIQRVTSLLVAALSIFTGAIAAPLIVPRQSITVLSASQISAYKPYTYFASTGYCSAAMTKAWNCGGKSVRYFCNKRVLITLKRTAMQTPDSSGSPQVEMEIISSIGLSDTLRIWERLSCLIRGLTQVNCKIREPSMKCPLAHLYLIQNPGPHGMLSFPVVLSFISCSRVYLGHRS